MVVLALTANRFDEAPVEAARFRPGLTLRIGSATVRTDPRLVLAERLHLERWQELLMELAQAVVAAPDLARLELLRFLEELNDDQLLEHFASDEESTDAFPVQP